MTQAIPRRLRWALAAIGMLAIPHAVSAHDVWLTLSGDPANRRVLINYGHPNDRPPSAADKVLDLVAVGSNGNISLLAGLAPALVNGIYVVESRPFTDDGHVLLGARYDNGFWIKTAEGLYRNATRRLAPGATDSLWSSKFAKALTGPQAPWQMVLGHDLEIVPLSDPAAVKPGQDLRLRVLFQGKPLAGAEVERGDGTTPVAEKDIPRFPTDAEGVASVPITNSGPHLLVIDHTVKPSATPDQADSDLFTATLWFNVAGTTN
jgi:nickel transport protein